MNAIKSITAAAMGIVLAASLAACTNTPAPTDSPEPTVTAEPTATPEPVTPVPGDQVPVEDVTALREQGLSVYVSPTGVAVVVEPGTTELPAQAAADLDAVVGVTSADDAELRANREAYVQAAQAIVDAGLGAILIEEGMSFRDGTWFSEGLVAGGIGAAKGACRSTGGPVSRAEAEAVAAECAAATGFQVIDLTK